MSYSFQDNLEQVLADYRRNRENLQALQEKMTEKSSTATAPRNAVSATVDIHGQVTAIAFPTNAYKNMAPAELANAVRDTVRKAQQQAREEMIGLVEPMMPEGMSMRGAEPGKIDVDRFFPDDPEKSVFLRALSEGK
ncbi:YbaB/EbfC family nucleoid-associated protein [Saccharopolyspora shandongensis]|uniref:YbaB/EbfC family nucleoid-associated protein n=1 Tax=Saccharopolyspora shandongensis TaxID=418495 RepID=UPI0033D730CB